MICIEHVTVEYEKGIKALDDFSLIVKPGELIVLCGKSGCENRGWDKTEIFERMHDSVEAFGIQRLVNRDIFSLSGGEKQMVACGSIYATAPSIMVLDEPSSNLDLKSIGKLRAVLKLSLIHI